MRRDTITIFFLNFETYISQNRGPSVKFYLTLEHNYGTPCTIIYIILYFILHMKLYNKQGKEELTWFWNRLTSSKKVGWELSYYYQHLVIHVMLYSLIWLYVLKIIFDINFLTALFRKKNSGIICVFGAKINNLTSARRLGKKYFRWKFFNINNYYESKNFIYFLFILMKSKLIRVRFHFSWSNILVCL